MFAYNKNYEYIGKKETDDDDDFEKEN